MLAFGLALCGMWLGSRGDAHGGFFLGIFAITFIPAGAAILAAVWAARPRSRVRGDDAGTRADAGDGSNHVRHN